MNGDAREAEPKAGKGRIVATYDYTDEHGGLLFQAVRYQPKSFKQRRPDGRAAGCGSLEGVRRVLYRLPEVLAADEVIVVEGEKDADRLRALGFVATTNPQGAGKWRPEYAEALAGKRVVVLPDNDEAGRKHAGKVAAEPAGQGREREGARARRACPRRATPRDWLDAGHTADELRRLIAEGGGAPAGLAGRAAGRRRRAPRVRGQRRDRAAPRARARRPAPVRRARRAGRVLGRCRGRPARAGAPWTDNDDTALAIWCQHQGVKVRPATCAAAVQLVAADHPHHPVRAYLDGLRWDGTPRLDTWLEVYLGAKVEPGREKYLRQVGRKTLIQPVARAYEPGCKADHLPVLRGPQGIGKSTAIRILAKDEAWFADEVADLGSKDAAQDLRGKWLIEMPELAAMRGREVERTKAFISRRVDHYRPSYGRRSAGPSRASARSSAPPTRDSLPARRDRQPPLLGHRGRPDRPRGPAPRPGPALGRGRRTPTGRARRGGSTPRPRRWRRRCRPSGAIDDVWEGRLLEWAGRQLAPFTIGEALAGALNVPVETAGPGRADARRRRR